MRRAVIITASDSGYRGEREDLSGPAVREILEKEGYQGYVGYELFPLTDTAAAVKAIMEAC